jgi:hypothetical protein
MKFEKYDGILKHHSANKMKAILHQFMAANIEVAKITDWEDAYSNLNSLYVATRDAIKQAYPKDAKAYQQNGEVFLVNLRITEGR